MVERAILITGSGSGIGAAICARLAGPRVGVLVHAKENRAGVARVAEAARAAGAEAVTALGDLADPETGAALVARAVEAFGRLDVLVANAGFPDRRPFGTLDRAGYDYVQGVVAAGFFEMATAALPHLQKARDGRVVTISTHNAHIFRTDYPFYPASAAAKSALEALTRAFAMQLGPHGVTVNAVVPGLIRKDPSTPQFLSAEEWQKFAQKIPLGRIGEPEEIAATVAFLCSRDAAYITGQLIHVNGGFI
jgi:3-oxoacyl-[acyl-carrier protein] reductase